MDMNEWLQIVGAMFAGNAITMLWAAFWFAVHKAEKEGRDPLKQPIWLIFGGLFAPLVMVYGLVLIS